MSHTRYRFVAYRAVRRLQRGISGTYTLSGGTMNLTGSAYVGGNNTAAGGSGVFNINGTGSAKYLDAG